MARLLSIIRNCPNDGVHDMKRSYNQIPVTLNNDMIPCHGWNKTTQDLITAVSVLIFVLQKAEISTMAEAVSL